MEFQGVYDWQNFCDYLTKQNRYVLNKQGRKFVKTILYTAKKKRELTIKKGLILFRARIHCSREKLKWGDSVNPIDAWDLREGDIGAPPPEKAKDGRVNPYGISYLYLSSDEDTAIAEVRSWLEEEVTVGKFKIEKNLKLIDTSEDRIGPYCADPHIKDPSPRDKEEQVWSRINDSFSRPISSYEKHIRYIPTQYLAEVFKNEGYAGIKYNSALTANGYNVVLFEPNNAKFDKYARAIKITFISKPKYVDIIEPYGWKKPISARLSDSFDEWLTSNE